MKKTFLVFALICTLGAVSQNLQVHYDMGKDHNFVTTTFEMFKPDAYGNTFAFVDMDYNAQNGGVSFAYWEIARVFKTKKMPVGIQVEYNGGTGQGFGVPNAFLTGVDYSWNAPDFSKGFSVKALYKYIDDEVNNASFQLEGVWYLNLLNNKLSFNGFMSFWKQKNAFLGTDFVFLSQPQLWYNFNKNFSAGTEIELCSNFGGEKGFKVNPTLGLKYNF